MKKRILFLWDNNRGVSPVIGVMLMLFLTILLAGITVSAVYGADMTSSLTSAPMASIEVEYVEGGVPNQVRHDQNFISLKHMGGDPLQADSTRIMISGEGSSYEGVFGSGTEHYGDVIISYENLMFDGKLHKYATSNPSLSDGVWSAGEKLILNGADSINGGSSSTVKVAINGITDTANNYGLKENNLVSIKIFDSETQRIVSECECTVVLAE